jgi:hypothetical protein
VRTHGEKAEVDPGVILGLDAALWRSSCGLARELSDSDATVGPAREDETAHMDVDAECYHVLPGIFYGPI